MHACDEAAQVHQKENPCRDDRIGPCVSWQDRAGVQGVGTWSSSAISMHSAPDATGRGCLPRAATSGR